MGAKPGIEAVDKLELLRLIVEQLGEGVVVADISGRFVLWNRQAERIIGKGMSDLPVEKWVEAYGVFDPETKEPLPAERQPLARALRGEATDGVELYVRNPGVPEGVYLRVTGRPVHDAAGRRIGGVVVFRDATLERRARHAFKTLAAIVDSTPDAVIGLTPEGRVAEWNAGAAAMWGWPLAEARGRFLSALAPPKRRSELNASLDEALRFRPVLSREMEFARRDGRTFPGAMTIAPIRLANGSLIGASMIVRDVSEARRVETMKDQLLSVASHELRAPAAAVSMSLGLLAESLGQAEESRRILSLAERNCDRMIRLIAECLDAESLRAGRIVLRREPCDLAALAREAVELNQPFARRFGVRLEAEALPAAAPVLGDARRLLQALTNLLTNAAKFSPRGETVRVSIERQGERFRVSVVDRGPGIPAEFRDRVFQRFARARSVEAARMEGAGLGLSIAKDIVEGLGGRIGYVSAPGRGTTFFFELDAAH